MKMTEEAMLALEANIPKLARGAFERAYFDALTQSGKVMRAINGQLVETYADGTEQVLRAIHAPVKVAVGTRLTRQFTAK
ncbi:MAG: hypothetical protein Q7U45_10995 [Burkholderiaceae bacterium]|jgi:hypothetical protein|nr:hypothetical protein [Burkholderiaceae bacterium]MDP3133712.1 hypothetical protein [Burkholderiaceae bacterium]MDZ4162387.1 hypothetical protein [Burkholderiales bacterium]